MGSLVDVARELAQRAHADQRRKALGEPYFSHLEAVAELLREHGHADDVTVASAYLHDLVEDQPAFTAEMVARMPAEVVETVLALTEPKLDDRGHPQPKSERFDAYLRGLSSGSPAARRALPVSCADKIHNTRSILHGESLGVGILSKLRTRPTDHEPQLERLRALYAGNVSGSLLAAYDEARESLRQLVRVRFPC